MGARGRNFYYDLACRFGYEQEADTIQEAYLAGRKDEAAALVPADLVEKTALIGPAGYVAERLAAFRESRRHHAERHPAGRDPRRPPRRHRARPRPRRLARRSGQPKAKAYGLRATPP